MIIRCKYDELLSPSKLKAHPKNRNKHTKEQIERLAKLLAYQGIRAPIVVSSLSGCIVKGHGTLEAIKLNKSTEAPVVFQDFENEEQEYAFVQSDNAIASWSELDLSGINADIGDLGPDFDIDLLGLKSFALEPAEKFLEKELWGDDFESYVDKQKIIIIFKDDVYKPEILQKLGVKNSKKFKDGKVLSVNYPEDT